MGPQLSEFRLPGEHSDYVIDVAKLTTTREVDIGSVLPLLTTKINFFLATLTPRERVQVDVEDLVQEVFLTLFEKHHHYDRSITKFTTFSVLLAFQRLSTIRAKAARYEADVRRASAEYVEPDNSAYAEAETRAEASSAADKAYACLDFLRSPLQRAIIVHWYGLHGCRPLSAKEMSAKIGLSQKKINSIRMKAEANMKACFDDESDPWAP